MALNAIHKQNSSLCVCFEGGHQIAWWGIDFRKKRIQLCMQIATVWNKLLAEVPEMPGVF